MSKKSHTLNSPLTGTFYQATAPGRPPFVRPGSEVKEGDVVCIIESMKVFIDVRAQRGGVVSKVLVGNEDQVTRDQPLVEFESHE